MAVDNMINLWEYAKSMGSW